MVEKETKMQKKKRRKEVLTSYFFPFFSSTSWIWLYLISLIVLIFWGYLITQVIPLSESCSHVTEEISYEEVASGFTIKQPFRSVLEPWLRWDTIWYMKITKYGYHSASPEVAFPPLYPLLIRMLGKLLGGQYLLASLIISWSAFFGSCYLLNERIEQKYKDKNMKNGIRYMLFFPSAFFFYAGYTESLFLLFVLLAWHHADQKDWFRVGLLGALAVLTRFVGIFLILPFGYMWWKNTFRKTNVMSIFSIMLIPLAFLFWGNYTSANYDISPSSALNLGWALHFDWPWVGIIGSIQKIFSSPISSTIYIFFDLVVVVVAFSSLMWWLKRKKIEEAFFICGTLLISLMKIPNIGTLGSTSRYILPLFPIYLTRPIFLENKLCSLIILFCSTTLWLLCATMFFTCNWIA